MNDKELRVNSEEFTEKIEKTYDGEPTNVTVTAELLEKRVFLTSRIVPNGDHCEACWEEQIPFFMGALLYNRD